MRFRCLPIVRHVRYFYHKYKFQQWWTSMGQHYWSIPNPHDYEYLNAIWRGEE